MMNFSDWKEDLLKRSAQFDNKKEDPIETCSEPELDSPTDFDRAFSAEIERLHLICRQVNIKFGYKHYANKEGHRLLNELNLLRKNILRLLDGEDLKCPICERDFRTEDEIETVHKHKRMFIKHKHCEEAE